MKPFIFVIIAFFTSFALAFPPQVEVINKNGEQEVWLREGLKETFLGKMNIFMCSNAFAP